MTKGQAARRGPIPIENLADSYRNGRVSCGNVGVPESTESMFPRTMKNLSEPLDEEELAQLDDFLLYRLDNEAADVADGDEGIIDVSELDGFLTALVSGPNVLVPSRWLPAIWGEIEPCWESEDEVKEILGLILRHQNSIVATLDHDPQSFEPIFGEREVDGEIYYMLEQWCHGYMRGVALDAAAWSARGPDIEELMRPIRSWGTEEGSAGLDVMSDVEMAREEKAVAASVRALYKYWLDRRDLQPTPILRDSPKVGRNEPCPCGSGKKYKQCCLQ